MAVQFIIGRAGTGKTHRCFTRIVAALRAEPVGPPIYWIVPRQATFSVERELTCASGLGGFVRARVVSFEQLSHEILAECGGATIPELTPVGRRLILGHLLRRNAGELRYFKHVARQPGLAAKLDATFSEFERAGKDAGDLELLMKEMGGDGSAALLDKVHDLHLIYHAYSSYLGDERLDQHKRLLFVLDCLKDAPAFRGATVYVDGFRDFSEYERQVMAQLGKVCRHVEVTLPMDPSSEVLAAPELLPHEMNLFHPVEMAYRRLRMVMREAGTGVDEPAVLLTQPYRFRNAALAEVERAGFQRKQMRKDVAAEGVERVEAPTRAAEVDAAARRIRELLAAGYRLREILVLARDTSPYQDLVHASFGEHGIPYFLDRRRPMAHHPLLQFVRAVLVIAQQAWPHEWLMTLLKTGLTGLADGDADELENYVLRHRIRGAQWAAAEAWAYHEAGLLRGEDAPPASIESAGEFSADRARRVIVGALAPFIERTRGTVTVREVVAALFDVIAALPARQTIARWMEDAKGRGQFELRDEHQQVWAELTGLFDQMVELLGDERIGLAGFQEVLEAGLESFDLALTPPTVDEVLVGDVERTRPPEGVRAVLVLGLAEGVFPAVHREESVLNDADRRVFHDRAMAIGSPTDRLVLDEWLQGYFAFTAGSELLYLSRPRANESNKPLGPSAFWERVGRMFPGAPLTVLPRDARDDASLIATPRQLVAGLMRWVREDRDVERPDSPWPSLYQWLTTQACDGAGLDDCRYGAWRALGQLNGAALSPAIVRQLFASPLSVGVAQLETFAACPFKHFLSYGLGLQPRESDEGVSALDLGNVYHQVLDRVVADLLKQRKTWVDLTDAQRQRVIHRIAGQISQGLRGEIFLSSARNKYLLDRIERTLNQVVATQKTAAGRGRFRPAHTNVRFGPGGTLPEFTLATPRGAEVRLSGKIDRVDLHESGDAAVVDYKLGDRRLSLDEVYHGLSLQLLTYLLVLEANGEALAGRQLTPAAAFYVRMLRWMGSVEHPDQALSPDDPLFHLAAKPRGIVDERVVREIDASLETGASDVINVHVNKDGSFGKRGTCDGADGAEFAALLAHVRRRLGELADGVLAGEVGIKPYMLGQRTPCPQCDYRSVCRFEPAERYNVLTALGREGVLTEIARGSGRGDEPAK